MTIPAQQNQSPDTEVVEDDFDGPEAADMSKPEPFQKIWHGDSRLKLQKVPYGSVDCIITDPPFGVDNQSHMAVTAAGKEHARKIANDESPEQAIAVFLAVMNELCPRTADDCDMYVFTSYHVLERWLGVARWLEETHQFKHRGILIWDKGRPNMGNLDGWAMGYEYILYLKKGQKKKQAKRRNGIISVPAKPPGSLIHPHEKPTQLLDMLIKFSTRPRDFIVDPFGGSGSLARAAARTGRSALCIEYDERNYEAARKALEDDRGGMF